jgi:transcriptional antiterminator
VDRVLEIIKALLNNGGYLTVDEIAEKLRVSNKTIRNDLCKVQEYLAGNNLALSKKSGVGVAIVGGDKERLELMSKVMGLKSLPEPFTPEVRKELLLKRLLINEDSTTIKELSEELFVSRVTIQKDLEEVEEWLEEYGLKLLRKTNFGIQIVGNEENWRKAVINLIYSKKENEELKDLLVEEHNDRIDYKTNLKLKELVNLDYNQLVRIVTTAETQMKFSFSDEAFMSLVIHIAIAIKRLQQKKDIQLSGEVMKGLRQHDQYYIAEGIASAIEDSFKLNLPECEIGYILLHILGAKMHHNRVEESDLTFINKEEDELACVIAKEIIEVSEKVFSLDLQGDKQLFNGLILHLRPTINRLKYGLALRNPMIEEIKETCPEAFGAAWMCSGIFEKYLAEKITEEEIGYIALHLAAAIDRQKVCLKVLVVCTSGVGTSQLLAARLGKHFRDIEVIDVISSLTLKEKDLSHIDMIISTVPLHSNTPTISISPLLTQNDIKRLDLFIKDILSSQDKLHFSVRNLFTEEFIETDAAYKSREAVIEALSNRLLSGGYIKKGFLEDVLRREQLSATAIGNQVAIPHGNPRLVNKSQIAMVILKKAILWGDEPVNTVFMICIAEVDLQRSKKLFKSFYNKIDSIGFLEGLKNSKGKVEIKKLLEGIGDVD